MHIKRLKTELAALAGSPWFRLAVGIAISAVALYLALRDVAMGDILSILSRIDPAWTALALLSMALNTWAKVVRWKVLLGPAGRAISQWKLLVSLLVGQMLNTVFPARLGDLSRAYVVGSLGPGRTYPLGTVLIE